MTAKKEESSNFDGLVACREYIFPRDDGSSRPKGSNRETPRLDLCWKLQSIATMGDTSLKSDSLSGDGPLMDWTNSSEIWQKEHKSARKTLERVRRDRCRIETDTDISFNVIFYKNDDVNTSPKLDRRRTKKVPLRKLRNCKEDEYHASTRVSIARRRFINWI